MGKAGKWIRNLLLGKKEEKAKTSTTLSVIPSSPSCSTATPKRRWSFRRSNTNTEKVLAISHKSCRSFDSLITSQALFEYAIQQQKRTTMLPHKAVAVAAATKIQAAFRSYLAWKALCALRGLVKLQALVRGHLVRKRTTTMVRCMSALVAIQVRARFQRIQMADSRSHFGVAGKQGYMLAHEGPLQREHNKNLGRLGSNRQSSRRFSIDSPHEISMRLHNKPIDEVSTTSQTSRHHNEPNYMTRTNSSRAKARSSSEPRQRPTKQKREKRRTSSNEGLHYATQGIRNHDHQKDHDSEFDSASTCTNGSSYYTTLYAYEVST